MPRRIYSAGEPCDICQTPTIPGKKQGGAYCKPCYVKWAEAKKNGTTQYQAPLPAAQACNCEETIAKIRIAFAELTRRVDNVETFQEGQNPKAAELHHSFADTAAEILGGQIDPTK